MLWRMKKQEMLNANIVTDSGCLTHHFNLHGEKKIRVNRKLI